MCVVGGVAGKAKQAVYVPNVFRLQIDNCQAIKPKTFPADGDGMGGLDWAGLDWTLAEFEVCTGR